MSQTDPTPQLVERLLSKGLDLYGHNSVDEAVRCWQEVLQLQPDNAQALDYLDAAGAPHEPRAASAARPTALVVDLNAVRQRLAAASSPPAPHVEVVRARAGKPDEDASNDVAQLVEAGLFEQALQQLYTMRTRKPDDGSIAECIRLLRDRLLGQYWDTLGHLDRVPQKTSVGFEGLSVEERRVMTHVDGRASLLEVVESCQLGRLATSRVLCALLENGRISFPVDGSERDRVSVERVTTSSVHASSAVHAASAQVSSAHAEPTLMREEHAPPTTRSGGGYEALFRDATSAYISRRYELALQLFNECLRERPQDARVLHNLRQLERRLPA